MAKKIAEMSFEELTKLISEAQKVKRGYKARAEREKIKATIAPLLDAIDKAVASSPNLKELIEEKDAIRLYFSDKQEVNRDTYRLYAQREYNGNNGGQKQYKRKDKDAWVDVPNTTWKSAAVKLNVHVGAQSAQTALNKAGYDTQVLDDDGNVTSENKGK